MGDLVLTSNLNLLAQALNGLIRAPHGLIRAPLLNGSHGGDDEHGQTDNNCRDDFRGARRHNARWQAVDDKRCNGSQDRTNNASNQAHARPHAYPAFA